MRKEVKVLGLSYSQTQVGSYILILSEQEGSRKVPIIIKSNEAQIIAMKIEGLKSPRPLTHDLFKSFSDSFGVDVPEVLIHNIVEGVFQTRLIASNGIDDFNIECTIGDGIAMALTFDCPIYIEENVLESSGVIIETDVDSSNTSPVNSSNPDSSSKKTKDKVLSIEDLEYLMNEALSNEEYEIAAELRDRIKTIKESEKNI